MARKWQAESFSFIIWLEQGCPKTATVRHTIEMKDVLLVSVLSPLLNHVISLGLFPHLQVALIVFIMQAVWYSSSLVTFLCTALKSSHNEFFQHSSHTFPLVSPRHAVYLLIPPISAVPPVLQLPVSPLPACPCSLHRHKKRESDIG